MGVWAGSREGQVWWQKHENEEEAAEQEVLVQNVRINTCVQLTCWS